MCVCARVHTCAQQKIERYSERNRNQCGRRDPDAGTVKEERLRAEKKHLGRTEWGSGWRGRRQRSGGRWLEERRGFMTGGFVWGAQHPDASAGRETELCLWMSLGARRRGSVRAALHPDGRGPTRPRLSPSSRDPSPVAQMFQLPERGNKTPWHGQFRPGMQAFDWLTDAINSTWALCCFVFLSGWFQTV